MSVTIQVKQARGESLEAAARHARYKVFAESIHEGEVLCLAHHQDDQAETLLLQLLRGAGVAGLSAMPACKPFANAMMLRPLLPWNRQQLRDYAEQQALQWIEDPSNEHLSFDRNYLRHEVMPLIKQRWPAAAMTIARSANHIAEANGLLQEVAQQDWQAISNTSELPIDKLLGMSEARQRNLLRFWIQQVHQAALPDHKRLSQIMVTVLHSKADRDPEVCWDRVCVRRFQGQLYLLPRDLPQPSPYAWNMHQSLDITALSLRLQVDETGSGGLKPALVGRKDVRIAFRQGGERCRPQGRGGQHQLKKLMQEWGIPTWQRSRIPLLYVGDEIAAVVGHCYCEPFVVEAGQAGLALRLLPLSGDGIASQDENNDNSPD